MKANKTILSHFKTLLGIITLMIVLNACSVTEKRSFTQKEYQKKIDSLITISKINKTDTFKIKEYKTKLLPVRSIIKVPIECDTSGNVKPFSVAIGSGNNKTEAFSINNTLVLDQKTDSIVNSLKEIYKSRYQTKIDSLKQIINQYQEKSTEKLEVKKKPWFIAHLKCLIVIGLLLVVIYFLITRK